MKKVLILIINIFLVFSCEKEEPDPSLITHENLFGNWVLTESVSYIYDEEKKNIIDSIVYKGDLQVLRINTAKTCEIQGQLPFPLIYEYGFIAPDTFWIYNCPVDTYCALPVIKNKYHIIDFHKDKEMTLIWYSIARKLGVRKYKSE